MTGEREELYGLTYIKLYVDELELLEEALTPEAAAALLFAVGNYAKDRTVRDLPAELQFAFADFRRKVDIYRRSCASISKKRAANGAKGGGAKAANAKNAPKEADAPESPGFRPPNQARFQRLAKALWEAGRISAGTKEVADFYEFLVASQWSIHGTPVGSEADIEALLSARFPAHAVGEIEHLYWPSFVYLWETYGGLRNAGGDTCAALAAAGLLGRYDAIKDGWTFQGKFFRVAEYKMALDRYVEANGLANGSKS